MKLEKIKNLVKKLNKVDLIELQDYIQFILKHEKLTKEAEEDFELHGILGGRILFISKEKNTDKDKKQ
jgi:hypothetical protein